jgi:hypothetical protein
VSLLPGRTAGPDRVAVTTREFVAAIQLSRSGVRCGRRSTGCGVLLECGLTRAHMSPWQKGAVENANGRVRRFLPRESAPEALSRAHLRRLADRLNDTPRRRLGYRTPREVFQEHLAISAGPP